MFGSRKQPSLTENRRIVLTMPLVLPAIDASQRLADFLAAYGGNKPDLMFGFWEFGDELVVTAPTEAVKLAAFDVPENVELRVDPTPPICHPRGGSLVELNFRSLQAEVDDGA